MKPAEIVYERIARTQEAYAAADASWYVNTSFDEPPTPEPTFAEWVQYEAQNARVMLELWRFAAMAGDDYCALAVRAFDALYAGDPARAKALGRAKQAAHDALTEIAREDVRALALVAERAVWNTLCGLTPEAALVEVF